MNKSLFLLALVGFVAACAPPIEKREYSKPKQNFDTRLDDADLDLRQNVVPQSVTKTVSWKGEVASADYLQASETLIRMGRKLSRPKLEQKGEKLATAFYKKGSTDPQFVETLIATAAIKQAEPELHKYLDTQVKMIDDSKALILRTLKESRQKFPFPKTPRKAETLEAEARKYMTFVLNELRVGGLNPDIQTEVEKAIKEHVEPEINHLRPYLWAVINAKTARTMLAAVKQLMVELGADKSLDEETKRLMDEGDAFAAKVEAMQTGEDALQVLIAVWERLTPEARAKELKSVSPELYDFFNGLSNKEWKCLKNPDCDALINIGSFKEMKMAWAKKKIKSELKEKVGIDNLRKTLDDAARKELMVVFEEKSTSLMTELPRVAEDKVQPHLGKPYEMVNKVRADAKGFIQNLVNDFGKKRFSPKGEAIAGIEAARVLVDWKSGQAPSVKPVKGNKFESSGAAIGAGFALAESRLGPVVGISASSEPNVMRDVLAQINKIMAVGGFDTGNGKMYPAYSVSHEPGQPKHVNLEKDLDSSKYFAVPERFALTGNYTFVPAKVRSATVRSQAEMLRGLSAMIRYMRDWESNSFDKGIARIKAGDIVGGAMGDGGGSGGLANLKLFNKTQMYTAAVANAAIILKGLEPDGDRQLSNAYMTNPFGDVLWLDKMTTDEDKLKEDPRLSPPGDRIMTGVVDIVNGKRQNTTRVGDLARYMLALSEFIEATKGIEKTQSPELSALVKENGKQVYLADGKTKKRTYHKILEAREDLKNLMMTIPNFIAGMMIREEDGLLAAEYDIERKEKFGVASALDHSLAIRALITAAKYTKISAHVIAALDTYYAMNRNLWNSSTRFYNERQNLARLPNPGEMIMIIDNLDALKETMPEKSEQQWEMISRPWLSAFEKL